MRLTPAQGGVQLICGKAPGLLERRYPALLDRLVAGRAKLCGLAGQDYGYDLVAWHNHLKESGAGGYSWRRNSALQASTAPSTIRSL